MNRTIAQRIYWTALLPLALLAVVLITVNGYSRIQDANRQLDDARKVAAELLNGPAIDALVVGNTLHFEQLVGDLYLRSDTIGCVALRDANFVLVSQAGECPKAWPEDEVVSVETTPDDLSDFPEDMQGSTVVGELLVITRQDQLTQKSRQIVLQLLMTLTLVVAVFYVIGRLIQTRLVQPIRQIDAAMQAVSEHQYETRIQIAGDDELGRLSASINSTIDTIQAYMRELTERRTEADRALLDADEAFMARDALVRSMSEDLEGPMSIMHSELTAVAIANTDPLLRDRIKSVMALLQEAETNFADLVEIATSEKRPKQSQRYRDLGDIVADMECDIGLFAKTERIPIHFVVSQSPLDNARSGEPTGIFICIDSVRLKKALIHIIRAVGKRCGAPGVYVNAELIKIDNEFLNVSIHLKAFYDRRQRRSATAWVEAALMYTDVPPPMLEWTDRETKIIAYLLRAIDITPTFSASPMGTMNILLDCSCPFSVHETAGDVSTDWMLGGTPVATTIVTNDSSLMRLTTRGELSDHDISLLSFTHAIANAKSLMGQDALLIDISDDITFAVSLIEQFQGDNGTARSPELIAVCPPGQLSEKLGNRLFELGFKGLIQKPLQLGRVVEVLRTTLLNPLQRIGASVKQQ
ncbi:MAG: HAMP domain-containing protein [Pseudomonadales bacterium]